MIYRNFGKTGIKISSLGFGAMRLPDNDDKATEVIRSAIDKGVNYVDTAYVYGESERRVGLALQNGYRNKVYISTKNPLSSNSVNDWKKRMEESLTRMQTDHIDFYNIIHAMNYDSYENFLIKEKALDVIMKYKEEGIIKHITFSTHDKPEGVIKSIDTGIFEGVTIQYNLLNRDYEDAIAYAHEKGLGTVIMGPVGGGILGTAESEFTNKLGEAFSSTPELAIRFILANPNVTCALSGMGNLDMVNENVKTASNAKPLNNEEMEKIEKVCQELKEACNLYCTGCRYCMPCPNNVDIPACFSSFNTYKVYGALNVAKRQYGWISADNGNGKKDNSGAMCIECGECMPKCPQKIDIISQLKEVEATLK